MNKDNSKTIRELSERDFCFDGPLGSKDAAITKIGPNHFKVELGELPGDHDGASNQLQFSITGNAKGNNLALDVCGIRGRAAFNVYFMSYSYDLETWYPVQWRKPTGMQNTSRELRDSIYFSTFAQDKVYVGSQVPFPFEQMESLVKDLAARPGIDLHVIGKSMLGKNLYRLVINPENPESTPLTRHYFASQHCEPNAQHRMIGMINWILSPEGKAFRDRNICHFCLLLNPDSPSKGWYIFNSEGKDMQRWNPDSPAPAEDQPYESKVAQDDFEKLMSKEPFDTVWSMHTWQGPVENMVIPGKWFETKTSGTWRDLRNITLGYDRRGLCKPLREMEVADKVYRSWGHGPFQKYGVTSFGCEGAGTICTKEDNLETGRILIRGLAEFQKKFEK